MIKKKRLIIFFSLFFVIAIFLYLFVIAENPATVLWNVTMDGPQNSYDYGYGVAIDNNSNVYVVGQSYWSNATSGDIYVGKFNSSGSNLWNATLNGPQNNDDVGYGIAVDNESNIYVVGSSLWNSATYYDIYIGKFNSTNGANIWNATIDGFQNKSDFGYGIAVSNGSIYVIGKSLWSNATSGDIYVGKFNSSGSNLWNATIDGPQRKDDEGHGIAISNNSIYITGFSRWSNASTTDIYLGKFNSSGSNLWNATIDGPKNKNDLGYGIAVDNNSIYIVGYSYWSNASTTDIYLGKFNSSGSNLWNATLNGPQNDNDFSYGIALDNSSNIYITGFSRWSSDLYDDIYIGKFNSSGSNLWNATIKGSAIVADLGYGIAIESSLGDIYVTGTKDENIYLAKFSVDTINPTAVFTCSPASVTVGGTITCSCTPSDVFSGINSSLTLYTPNPSTSQVGTFTTTCTFADIVGNTGSATATYTVNAPGGEIIQNVPITSQSLSSISPNQPTEIIIDSKEIDLTKITVSVTELIQNASLTISKINILPKDLKLGFPVGTSYQIFEINTRGINEEKIDNATIDFKVNKAWLAEQNGTVGDIALYRKQDLESQWNILSTTYTSEDNQYYYFSALSPGFSTFLVFFGKYECEIGSKRCFNDQIQMCVGNSTWLITKKCGYGCKEGECMGIFSISTIFYTSIIAVVSVGILITLYLGLRRLFKKKKGNEKLSMRQR